MAAVVVAKVAAAAIAMVNVKTADVKADARISFVALLHKNFLMLI